MTKKRIKDDDSADDEDGDEDEVVKNDEILGHGKQLLQAKTDRAVLSIPQQYARMVNFRKAPEQRDGQQTTTDCL